MIKNNPGEIVICIKTNFHDSAIRSHTNQYTTITIGKSYIIEYLFNNDCYGIKCDLGYTNNYPITCFKSPHEIREEQINNLLK